MILSPWLRQRFRSASITRKPFIKSKRPGFFYPHLEVLEDRRLLAIFTVLNTNDSGPGSLRQAILDANGNPGLDTIAFDIGGGGSQTIQPASALPAITDPVIIDGTTQPGFSDSPLIVLDGTGAGTSVDGLTIATGNSTLRGLVIEGFTGSGIDLRGDGNLVAGNWIGTDPTGTAANGNGDGILVEGNSNRIGGSIAADRNLISGNRMVGIDFSGHFKPPDASDNLVQGNLIGTDVTGTQIVANITGIEISGGAVGNTIGGSSAGARNVISGNQEAGIEIGFGADTLVQGNFIGTDVMGAVALPNRVGVVSSSLANSIGGTASGAGNLISGNILAGVSLAGESGPVQGNFIGTDATGTQDLGNGTGVSITNNISGITVGGAAAGAGNLISGNREVGLDIMNGTGILVLGNRIGTDITGTRAVGNHIGIAFSGGSGNTVGGANSAARNLISGNTLDGIDILNSTGNLVQGNAIGTDVSGTLALGNGFGIYLFAGSGNTVGGTASGAGNLISGNLGPGIDMVSGNNRVLGNSIGTDISELGALGNRDGIIVSGSGNTIGGTVAGGRNVIAGNLYNGVQVSGSGNLVQGNFIGTDGTGTAALGNRNGVAISGGSRNTVGGTAAGTGNLISGNGEDGIVILDGSGNQVQGNVIGTDVTRMAALGNRVGINLLGGATDTTIGGTVSGAGNLIAGNRADGISIAGDQNQVQGNFIGTDISANAALGNAGNGVSILGGSGNTIGGTTGRNLVSGNRRNGIFITGSNNQVQGNYIGTDGSGTAGMGNAGSGIFIASGAANNTVGGTEAGMGNLISANTQYGVFISDGSNRIAGNTIGTDVGGKAALGNNVGVYISHGSANMIGGTEAGAGNLISGNGTGVIILASGNRVQGNFIGTDRSGTFGVGNGFGVTISTATTDTTIGGTIVEARNIISGNRNEGVDIITSSRNLIQGNFIGTDITGTQAVGNGMGVSIRGGSGNQIGGTASGAGNLISGNAGDGVFITSSFSSANFVQGNTIGTDITGATNLGNGLNGVHLASSSNNLIGGEDAGAANTIAFNGSDGVLVDGGNSNSLRQNSIFGSGNLGIELLNNGNHNQEYPVIASAVSADSTITIEGTLMSAPMTTFAIEFFVNSVCNPSGFGEGETFLGSATVTTDGAGHAEFSMTLDVAVDPGRFITATATDPGGNTSQFSQCTEVTGPNTPRWPGFPPNWMEGLLWVNQKDSQTKL